MLAWISAFAEMTFVFASPVRRLLSWAEERGSCPMPTPATLLDKIWSAHAIETRADGAALLSIDRHLVHDGSSTAFRSLKERGLAVRRPDRTFATPDHYVSTLGRTLSAINDPNRRGMVEDLEANARKTGVTLFGLADRRQGIVHVIGGELAAGVHAKDVILAIIAGISAAGGAGHVIEYAGSAIRNLSIEGRLTICNMSIEAGARAGMVAPDETTFAYLKGRPYAPKGTDWETAVAYWRTLPSDPEAAFDREVHLDAAEIAPMVTWGTSPEAASPITG